MAKEKHGMSTFQKLILVFVGIASLSIAYFFVIYIPSHNAQQPLTVGDCLKLGSNERTTLCLQQLEANKPVIPFTDLSMISLENGKMEGNSYYVPNPTYTATLRNNSDVPLKNIVVQFKFYKYNSITSCDDPSSEDTEYVNVSNLILPHDSQAIKTIVNTNFDTSGAFTWCTKVTNASQYN